MNFQELDRNLRKLNADEIEARDHWEDFERYSTIIDCMSKNTCISTDDAEFVRTFPKSNYLASILPNQDGKFTSDVLFGNQTGLFHIYQHDRFGYCPYHGHDFIEMLYVYDGECRQVIDGQEITMYAGDVCILDLKTKHRILPASENDIYINFLMKPFFFQYRFYEMLGENDLISGFFLKAIMDKQDESRYLLFQLGKNERVSWILNSIMCEYNTNDLCVEEAITSLLPLFFIELLRFYRDHAGAVFKSSESRSAAEKILSYIKMNYNTCTLKELSAQFHYSPTYLAELLSKNLGKSFTALRREIRLQSAALLLKNSDMPITEISQEIGYLNTSHFYRIFKERYEKTPKNYRNHSNKK